MEPLNNLLNAILLKLVGLPLNPANVMIGESNAYDLMKMADTSFPRAEVLITKSKENGNVDQYSTDEVFRINIAGYIKRNNLSTTTQDMLDLIKFANDSKKAVKSLNKDAMQGNAPCKGFLMLGDYAEIFYEYEFMKKLGSFLIDIEFKLNLSNER